MPDSAKTFSSVCSRFLEIHQAAGVWKTDKTAVAYSAAFALFTELVGDRPVAAYTSEDAAAFRACLYEIPAGWKRSKELRDLKFEEARELDLPKLSSYVIRTRLLAVNSLFEYAKTKQFAESNIFEAIKIR